MTLLRHTLCKAERICSKRTIDSLFLSGNKSILAFPIRVVYMRQARVEGEPPVAVLMSVSKRKLRHAVDRNRTKRQLREAYRLNKQILWSYAEKFPDESIQVAFIWISDKLEESSLVHRKMVSLMQRIVEADERRNLQAEHDKAD